MGFIKPLDNVAENKNGICYRRIIISQCTISVIKEVTVWLPKLQRNGLDFLYNTTPRDLAHHKIVLFTKMTLRGCKKENPWNT